MFLGNGRPMRRARSAPRARRNCLELGYGRFLQTDPLGYEDGMNMYAYTGGDPINATDPSGMVLSEEMYRQQCISECVGSSYFNYLGSQSYTNKAGGKHISEGEFNSAAGKAGGYVYNAGSTSITFIFNSSAGAALAGQISASYGGISGHGVLDLLGSGNPGPSFGAFISAANNAFSAFPLSFATSIGPPAWLRGVLIHAAFASEINSLGGPYTAEVSYKNGVPVRYGTSGSVRADGIYGSFQSPRYAVELKSGFALPTAAEVRAYGNNLPSGTNLYGIIEALGK